MPKSPLMRSAHEWVKLIYAPSDAAIRETENGG